MSTEQNKIEPAGGEETVFHRAIQIESAAERADFLRSACGDDPAMLDRVEALSWSTTTTQPSSRRGL